MLEHVLKLFKSLPGRLWRLIRPPVVFEEFRKGGWESALELCAGYSDPKLLSNVANARRAYLEGRIPFERDGVELAEETVPWEALTGLASLAAFLPERRPLRVLDFGGAFATFPQVAKNKISRMIAMDFLVVEQPGLVRVALSENLGTDFASFSSSLEQAMFQHSPDVVFSSSAIQYVESPEDILASLSSPGVAGLILDRVPVHLTGGSDILTVQKTKFTGHNSSYPCWIFSEKLLLTRLSQHFEITFDFPALDGLRRTNSGVSFSTKGYVGLRRSLL